MFRTKEILVAASLAALLVGCVDSSTGAAARADMGEETKVETKAEPKAEAAAPVAEKAVEPAPAAEAAAPAEESTPAAEAAPAETEAPAAAEEAAPAEPAAEAAPAAASVNLTTCAGCHGAQFEKPAMGVSKIVKDMSKEDIVAALKGYKDGSYGASMKALMAGQVAAFDEAMIEAAAAQIKQ